MQRIFPYASRPCSAGSSDASSLGVKPIYVASLVCLLGFLTLSLATADDGAGQSEASSSEAVEQHLSLPAADEIDFNRDIRPILSENCFFCHGPDEGTREAGLRLDVREEAIDYGAILPGEADASELVSRIEHDDPDWVMPPPDSHKSLDDRQKALLRRWVESGAVYQTHWSFSRITRPELPENADHPVDAFVKKRLGRHGLDLSPPARPDRLLRRMHLDLVGLPPTWDETLAFTKAFQKDADEAVRQELAGLLDSPHYGERMAAHWLDLARYADTVGFHGDQNQNVFPYRDWVIRAFNENMPFDEFTIKQLAGDLLDKPTDQDLVATCFNRLNMMTREGGAQPKEYLAMYAADRVRTVGMTWLGLTTGCAECHDHKFDPFTTKDFYSLAAYFGDVQQWGVYNDYSYTPNPELKGYSNSFPFPPEIEVVSPALLREQAEVKSRLVRLAERLTEDSAATGEVGDARPGRLGHWWNDISEWMPRHASGWKSLPIAGELPAFVKEKAEQEGETKDGPENDSKPAEQEKKSEEPDTWKRFRVAGGVWPAHSDGLAAEDDPLAIRSIRLAVEVPASSEPRELKVRFFVEGADASREGLRPVAVRRADANRWLPNFSMGQIIHDVRSKWEIPATDQHGRAVAQRKNQYMVDRAHRPGDPTMAVFRLAEPLRLAAGESLRVEIDRLGEWPVTVDASPLAPLRPFDPDEMEDLTVAAMRGAVNEDVRLAWLLANAGQTESGGQIADLMNEYYDCRDGRAFCMVTQPVDPLTTRVLPRGNWQDESGPIVQPSTPAFLGRWTESNTSDQDGASTDPTSDSSGPRRTRLDLAQWLVHRDNPLTARVVVNRLWKRFFGEGLTVAADDLGAQGDPPSHPQLLDFLAVELIDSGWDLQHVIRLIVTSDTYQQDSRVRTELKDVDPDNRLLSYHPPRRLEAEVVRDQALAVSGLINLQMGGPPVMPYQPEGYYANLQFPNRQYEATETEDQYRRGLYMHWQRTFLHPMLANFDAPSREDCIAIRNQANTPQQALTLLNDPTFVEAAGELAFQILTEKDLQADGDESRLRHLIRRALQRDATSGELRRLAEFLQQQRQRFGEDREAVDRLASVGLAGEGRQWEALEVLQSAGLEDAQAQRAEWAAWTATARIVLNLHESITRY